MSSQDELKEILRAAGVEVTQATLSRDLKALGVVRVFHQDGGYFYACAANEARGSEVGRGADGSRAAEAEGGAPPKSEQDRPDREMQFVDQGGAQILPNRPSSRCSTLPLRQQPASARSVPCRPRRGIIP